MKVVFKKDVPGVAKAGEVKDVPLVLRATVGGAFTVTLTMALVVEAPWLSNARAVRAYVPAGAPFHVKE